MIDNNIILIIPILIDYFFYFFFNNFKNRTDELQFVDAQSKAISRFSSPIFIKNIQEEDPTMIKNLKFVKTMNKFGYITTNSQAGNKLLGKKSVIDGNPYEIIERAYITGFMLEKDAIKFIKNLSVKTDKNAIFISYSNNNIYLPSLLDIPLTIVKKKSKIEIITHMSTTFPINIWDIERKQAKLNKSEKIVYIFCYDTKWNRSGSSKTGLFTDVIKILKNI
jgi:hypothetical protein